MDKKHNYFHLIGASNSPYNGFTWASYDYNYIFVDGINEECYNCTEIEKRSHTQETTNHEIAHQFNVNSNCEEHHCTNNAWCNGDAGCTNQEYGFEYCIMHALDLNYSLSMRKDGIIKMDCDDLAAEYDGCGLTNCSNGISVRTNEDPE